jgi:eukaryotic-like serine/threonine-protein kinase
VSLIFNQFSILIDENGRACISDFGLSSPVGIPPPHELSAWTRGDYIAPERYLEPDGSSERGAHPASDVFAFGVLMYLIVTAGSHLPFRPVESGPRALVAAMKIKQGERPTRPRADQCDGMECDDALWALILACLSHEMDERPSADQVHHQLQAIFRVI